MRRYSCRFCVYIVAIITFGRWKYCFILCFCPDKSSRTRKSMWLFQVFSFFSSLIRSHWSFFVLRSIFFSLLSNRENQGIFLSSEMDFKKWLNFSRNGPQQTTPYNFTIAIPLYNVFSNCGRKINECIKGSTIFDYQFRKCEKRKPKIILKRTRNSLLFVVWRIYFDDFQTLFVMFHGFHLSRLLIFNHGECCPVLIKINDETRHTVLLPFLLLMKTHFYRFRLTLDLPRNISLNSHLTS